MKKYRIYNILFPVWLFYLLPTGAWLIILPANFLIDTLVMYFVSKCFRIEEYVSLWKQSILRIWCIGFVGDVLGALLILTLELMRDALYPDFNTFYFPGATLVAVPRVLLSAICIYFLNKRYAFAKTELDESVINRLSRTLAIFTAPYAMLIPLYG